VNAGEELGLINSIGSTLFFFFPTIGCGLEINTGPEISFAVVSFSGFGGSLDGFDVVGVDVTFEIELVSGISFGCDICCGETFFCCGVEFHVGTVFC
jgi:hypothetical protein